MNDINYPIAAGGDTPSKFEGDLDAVVFVPQEMIQALHKISNKMKQAQEKFIELRMEN